MKKIILFLITIFICFNVVYAETIVPSVNIIDDFNYKPAEISSAENFQWTGREYIVHDGYNGGYYKSLDLINWEPIKFDNSAVSDKDFYYSDCKFIFCDNKYIVLRFSRDGELSDWIHLQQLDRYNKLNLDNPNLSTTYSRMYVIDENYKVLTEINFDNGITAFSFSNNKFYVRTQDYLTNYEHEEKKSYFDDGNGNTYVSGVSIVPLVDELHSQPINKVYVSENGIDWTLDESLQEVPLSNNGRNLLSFGKGRLYYEENIPYYNLNDVFIGNDIYNTKKVVFEKTPLHIEYEKTDKKFYTTSNGLYLSYQKDNIKSFEVSTDGVYWYQIEFPNVVENKVLKEGTEEFNKIVFEFGNARLEYNTDEIKQIITDKYTEEPPFVQLNNVILGFEVPPVTENYRTLVPMRFLFEQIGANVEWDEATQTATATLSEVSEGDVQTFSIAEEKTVTFGIDNTTAVVNGSNTEMDVPARLVDGKTMVPLRFLSENLGYNVEWDEATKTAIITKD